MAPEQDNFVWEAPEFDYHEKSPLWYWISIILAVILIALALWQKNFLFIVFVIIAEAMIINWGRIKPRTLVFELGRNGLEIDRNKFHPFKNMESFALFEKDSDFGEIIFKKKGHLSQSLRIPAPAIKLEEIEGFLSAYLPQEEYDEHLTDTLSRLIRF